MCNLKTNDFFLAECLDAVDSCGSIYFAKLPLLPFYALSCLVKWADDMGNDEARALEFSTLTHLLGHTDHIF